MHVAWASDHGLLVTFDDGEGAGGAVWDALRALERAALPGVRNLHPAYRSLLVVVDPRRVDAGAIEAAVGGVVAKAAPHARRASRVIELPTCYQGAHAPDLDGVARHSGLSPDAVIALHSGAAYTVAFLGFAPGFPYLDGLPAALATPRLPAPRRCVPPGSVAIGGAQAGVYSIETPGGWRLIGRTPRALFRAGRAPPSLLAPGDGVRFAPIDEETYARLADEEG